MKGYGHHELVAVFCTLAYVVAPWVLTRDDPLFATFIVGVGVLVAAYVAVVVLGAGGYQWWRGLQAQRAGEAEIRHDGGPLPVADMVAHGRARAKLGAALLGLVLLAGVGRVLLHGIDPFDPGLW